MGRPRLYDPEIAKARHAENVRRWNEARKVADALFPADDRKSDAYRSVLRVERDRLDLLLGALPGDAARQRYVSRDTERRVASPRLAVERFAQVPYTPHDPLHEVEQTGNPLGQLRRFPAEVARLRHREMANRRNLAKQRAAQRGTDPEAERVAIDAERGALPGDEYPQPGSRAMVRHRLANGRISIDPRVDAMWRLFVDQDLTFAQIGRVYGLSRERVRQVCELAYGQSMLDLVRFRQRARARLRHWVDTAETMWPPRCSVCGVYVPRAIVGAAWNFCPTHEPMRSAVMLMCDPERHRKHAALTMAGAKRAGRYKGTGTPADMINKERRRWLTKGSKMHGLCTEAYALGWPLTDRLPGQILEQLRTEARRPEGYAIRCRA